MKRSPLSKDPGWSDCADKIQDVQRMALNILASLPYPESLNEKDVYEFLEIIAYDKDPSQMSMFSLLSA